MLRTLATVVLLTAVGACGLPAPGSERRVEPAPLASLDAAGVDAWLQARGHGAPGQRLAVLSDPGWAGAMDHAALVDRWAGWWSDHLPPGEVAARTDELRAALGAALGEDLD